jgi:SAM-dependent methyltransferase
MLLCTVLAVPAPSCGKNVEHEEGLGTLFKENSAMPAYDVYEDADFAKFYDWMYDGFDDDIAWYLELAKQAGSPILEVACGTGRVAIALARSGVAVVGLDLSEPMLAQARRKVTSEPQSVRDALSFVQGDMEHFQLTRLFQGVIVPNASLFHLQTSNALAACLSCLLKHLESGGILAIDCVAPHRMANQEVGSLQLVMEGRNPLTGLMTQEYNRKLGIDAGRQVVSVEHVYIEHDRKDERRYEFTQDYHWIEEQEGSDLLLQVGFMDVQTFGSYDMVPFCQESSRLMFLARKPLKSS